MFMQDISRSATAFFPAETLLSPVTTGIVAGTLVETATGWQPIEALRRGDQVVTAGGIVGKVIKVGEDGMVEVEIAEGVKVKVVRQTITQVMNKTEPASA